MNGTALAISTETHAPSVQCLQAEHTKISHKLVERSVQVFCISDTHLIALVSQLTIP
jgi:hypothetical protein